MAGKSRVYVDQQKGGGPSGLIWCDLHMREESVFVHLISDGHCYIWLAFLGYMGCDQYPDPAGVFLPRDPRACVRPCMYVILVVNFVHTFFFWLAVSNSTRYCDTVMTQTATKVTPKFCSLQSTKPRCLGLRHHATIHCTSRSRQWRKLGVICPAEWHAMQMPDGIVCLFVDIWLSAVL